MRAACAAIARKRAATESPPLISPLRGQLPPRGKPFYSNLVVRPSRVAPQYLAVAYAAVLEAVQNGTISEERLDRSVNKILYYKEVYAHA